MSIMTATATRQARAREEREVSVVVVMQMAAAAAAAAVEVIMMRARTTTITTTTTAARTTIRASTRAVASLSKRTMPMTIPPSTAEPPSHLTTQFHSAPEPPKQRSFHFPLSATLSCHGVLSPTRPWGVVNTFKLTVKEGTPWTPKLSRIIGADSKSLRI